MSERRFVDREEELRALERAWEARPGLAVVYGRRRVGKTLLVQEWLSRLRGRGARVAYYHALLAEHSVNLRSLAESIEAQLGLAGFSKPSYPGLDALLESLAARQSDAVVVIDEFTYWARSAPRSVSELQRFVDQALPGTKLLVVLVGSLVGVMFRSVVGGGAPLYGRAKLRLRVAPLSPWYTTVLHPWLAPADAVRLYALLGGIPYYHALVGEGWGVGEVVRSLLASPLSPLVDEPWFLLREEFRSPHPYYSILEAVSLGYRSLARISDYTGIPRSHASRYLRVLEELGFVEKVAPLFSKKGWYRVRDPVLRTWYSLIRPNLHLVEAGAVEEAAERILSTLDAYTATVFEEDILPSLARALASQGTIGWGVAGKWVHKGVDIDLVVADTAARRAWVFEAKWSDLSCTEARREAKRLLAKAERLQEALGLTVEKAFIAARSVECREPLEAVEAMGVEDMPFKR